MRDYSQKDEQRSRSCLYFKSFIILTVCHLIGKHDKWNSSVQATEYVYRLNRICLRNELSVRLFPVCHAGHQSLVLLIWFKSALRLGIATVLNSFNLNSSSENSCEYKNWVNKNWFDLHMICSIPYFNLKKFGRVRTCGMCVSR